MFVCFGIQLQGSTVAERPNALERSEMIVKPGRDEHLDMLSRKSPYLFRSSLRGFGKINMRLQLLKELVEVVSLVDDLPPRKKEGVIYHYLEIQLGFLIRPVPFVRQHRRHLAESCLRSLGIRHRVGRIWKDILNVEVRAGDVFQFNRELVPYVPK